MSARRQSSTTSLQKYARSQQATDEELANRSLDFCNAFWGIADGGYDVLLARIRGAVRTTEELKAFWRERAAIEEDYSKRLARLAKQTLGKDELGELRNSIDTLRHETDKQAASHANLAQLIRKDLEQAVSELLSKQAQFKRTTMASVEKTFKAKQTQEQYVKKARQKYEDDCVRINSYTAQSTLVQGKELEKIQIKLEKTQQTVAVNEREYSQCARALEDTTARWEKEWKLFCDVCQDMEEDRIEFFKDNIWAYANSVSTVCVSDDESCENLRVSLEQVEAEKDVENFVRDYSTGPQMPDPPPYIDYNSPNASQLHSKSTYRIAKFTRNTNRSLPPSSYYQAPPAEEPAGPGQAGVGAVGVKTQAQAPPPAPAPAPAPAATSRPGSVKSTTAPTNGASSIAPLSATATSVRSFASTAPTTQTSPIQATTSSTAASNVFKPRGQDGRGETIVPGAETMLKIGDHAYPVNVGHDPQQARTHPVAPPVTNIGGQDDPLARQLEELRSGGSGSVRGGGPVRRGTIETGPGTSGPAPQPAPGPANPPPAPSNVARSPSPAPPTAKYMLPPSSRSASPLPVEDVVTNYHQHLPGEVSRQNSVNRGRQPIQQGSQNQRAASPAREGFAGIGAGSRSPSPMPRSRSVSPAMQPQHQQQQQQRHLGYPASGPQQAPARAASPLGIALDPTGRVAQDDLVDRMYSQQQAGRPGSYYGHGTGPQSQGSLDNYGAPRPGASGYNQALNQRQYPPQAAPPPPGQQNYYSHAPRSNTAGLYNPHQPARQGSVNPPPPNAGPYAQPAPPVQQQQPVHPGYGYEQQGYQHQPPPHGGYAGSNGYQHDYGYQQPPQQQQYRSVSPAPPMNRSPSPAAKPPPTGQYTEAGEPILFYVKALYDYQATIDEEFDFQAGDIIAVTNTPEDGWWSGELLDESRRIPGKTIFPSNFVSLF